MSEFEKELDVKIKSGEIMKERYKTGCILSHFVNLKDIESTFKDWQPPKPLVVVPQIVADYIETQKGNDFDRVGTLVCGHFGTLVYGHHAADDRSKKHSELHKWITDNFDTFLEAIVNGYTVEKEQLYILKHIDLSEQDNIVSTYLSHSQNGKLQHERYSKDVDMSKSERCHFTQSEIDKLNIGSYEQIEVKVEEVEK